MICVSLQECKTGDTVPGDIEQALEISQLVPKNGFNTTILAVKHKKNRYYT
jgi:hypothetical protein